MAPDTTVNWQPAEQASPDARFRRLDSRLIVETVRTLHLRIEARFPGSGLAQVVAEMSRVAEETVARTHWIQKPHFYIRGAVALLCLSIIALVWSLLHHIRHVQFDDYTSAIQAVEASISSVVFIGAAIVFLVSWENRIKRSRALKAVHELRAMAHIVDMHQLTKDPESYSGLSASSPIKRREMTYFELNRYLDYCSDSLALLSKIAALYVQEFQDSVLLSAVDEVESLTSGFSRKIWQKLTILETLRRAAAAPTGPEEAPDKPD
ncbi:hypothetical protein IV102_22625 [bacterium]|nr:hypothetical protein [bacterium]